jgi:hypothetical protein
LARSETLGMMFQTLCAVDFIPNHLVGQPTWAGIEAKPRGAGFNVPTYPQDRPRDSAKR